MAEPDEDSVVISGISCRLPQSENMQEFRDNLMNGRDMVVTDESRYKIGDYGLPRRVGHLKTDLTRFDASFFGIHPKQASRMDPQIRLLHEVVFEALIDAGQDPNELRGSKTGVFVGSCRSETLDGWISMNDNLQGYALMGCSGTMPANRISFYFHFTGPSINIETACSTSLCAFDEAVRNIRCGMCDAAIVAGSQLILNEIGFIPYLKMGMLSADGKCKAFDQNGNGFVRSEGVVAVYIQKRKSAKRIYCTVLHSKNNSDGFKEEGITVPSGILQERLLREIYNDISVDPTNVTYIEAHGTGTKIGDPTELKAICEVFCKDRKTPLKIGSVKSNLGHTEAASGLTSIAKVLLAMVEKTIPGNLHYERPNVNITGLIDGRLEVVSQNTKLDPGLVAVNSFGVGGSNCHMLLKPEQDHKTPRTVHTKKKRLFLYPSRTTEGLGKLLQNVSSEPPDIDTHSLINETAHLPPNGHPFRGFVVLNGSRSVHVKVCRLHGYGCQVINQGPRAKVTTKSQSVWYIFPGMGSQWNGMGRDMMEIDTFKSSIIVSDSVLKPYGIDLYDMIMDSNAFTYETITNAFVAIAAIQIALVDVLTEIGIKPDGLIGHSVGELVCAYADGCLSTDETILAAYWRGQAIETTNLPKGAMAAVGLTWDEAQEQCPAGVTPACHNSEDNCTVSGPRAVVQQFVSDLKTKNIFAKEVKCSNTAFHSTDMKMVAPYLLDALRKVISTPKPRTSVWKSSSIPESQWDSQLAMYSSAEYHVNNLVSPVLFQEALKHVPDNAAVIEIGPHSLLQSFLKRSLASNCQIVGLMKRGHGDNVEQCLTSLGICYQSGVKFNPLKLEKTRGFPVPPGTKPISPLVSWDHSQTWDVYTAKDDHSKTGCCYEIDTAPGSEYHFLLDHKISGRPIFPAAGYLTLVWKTLASLLRQPHEQLSVELSDVSFLAPVILPVDGTVHLDVNIFQATGAFVLTRETTIVATGKIVPLNESRRLESYSDNLTEETDRTFELVSADIYKLSALVGVDYGPEFQGVIGYKSSVEQGLFRWTGNWTAFIDLFLQMINYHVTKRQRLLPTRLKSIIIDPVLHTKLAVTELPAYYNKYSGTCTSGGIRVTGLHSSVFTGDDGQDPILEKYIFIPYISTGLEESAKAINEYVLECENIVSEYNSYQVKSKKYSGSGSQANENSEIKTRKFSKGLLVQDPVITSSVKVSHSYPEFLMNINLEKNVYGAIAENMPKTIARDRLYILQTDSLMNVLTQSPYLKVCLDIVLENVNESKIEVMEIGDRGMTKRVQELLVGYTNYTPNFLIAKDETQITNEGNGIVRWNPMQMPKGLKKKNKLTILNNILHEQPDIDKCLKNIISQVDKGGFLLVHEWTHNFHLIELLDSSKNDRSSFTDLEQRSYDLYCSAEKWKEIFTRNDLDLIFQRTERHLSSLFLLRKKGYGSSEKKQDMIDIGDKNCLWLDTLKSNIISSFKDSPERRIWIESNEYSSGIIGMVNCLRKEPGGEKIRCILRQNCENLDEKLASQYEAISKDLVMNVFREGCHGSYRHIRCNERMDTVTQYAFVDQETEGNLSSFRWTESPLNINRLQIENTNQTLGSSNGKNICSVHYAALNFRDVMLATGKLPADAIPDSNLYSGSMLGIEFSGKDNKGRRVMGMLFGQGLATAVEVQDAFVWPVPSEWTLEEAATVPVVYATGYYALVVRGNIQTGEKILIHSGTGGVGQAAISIALKYNCEVFTTVGTKEKKEYLMQKFPNIHDDHIFSSRDTNFKMEILKATQGKGVDIVLNSLSEEKLQASIEVLAMNGRFLEIGKYDLSKNTELGMSIFLRNISFHGILVDALNGESNDDWKKTSACLLDGINDGTVVPLKTTVFGKNEIEEAFRYMARGQHIGKILLEMNNNDEADGPQTIIARRKTYFHPNKCYIIVGGLGGFGLELSQWMVGRGARNLILTTRSGVKTGYQKYRLQCLKNQGADIRISRKDIRESRDAKALLLDTNGLSVGGIFNLAVVLRDAQLENQTQEFFLEVCKPKVFGTINLDRYSRELCRETCDWFVVFSSISSGFGNAGQSNYGLANSAMERICEKRRADGLPGLAIQWGPIGDVGVYLETVGNNDTVINGTIPQRIVSCLSVLDDLFHQDEAIVSSYVAAESISVNQSNDNDDLVTEVCRILGIKDPEKVQPDQTLGNLGVDSLITLEIQLLLQKKYKVLMQATEIRQLSLENLGNMTEERIKKDDEEQFVYTAIPSETIVKLNDKISDLPPLYIIHSMVVATTEYLEPLSKLIEVPVYGVQCTKDVPTSSLEDMAAFYLEIISKHRKRAEFHLAGYSMGVSIVYEMVKQLEERSIEQKNTDYGVLLNVIMFDGLPSLRKAFPISEGLEFESHKIQLPSSKTSITMTYTIKEYIAAIIGLQVRDVSEDALAHHKKIFTCGMRYEPKAVLNREIIYIFSEEQRFYEIYMKMTEGVIEEKVKCFRVPGNHFNMIHLGNEQNVALILNPMFMNY